MTTKTADFIELFAKNIDINKDDYTIKELNVIVKNTYNETYKCKGKRGKKTEVDGEAKPKKELSPYNIFMKEKMAELKEKHPEMNAKDKFKIVAEEWSKQKSQ